ncbi:capsid protein [Crucivirus-472]|nr:capsid protein [Crucivirus-472]
MAKRARTGGGGINPMQRKAAAINRKINMLYPYSTHGRTYLPRGIPGSWSMQTYGPTFKDATTEQRTNRQMAGFVGRGRYMGGRGGYGKRVLNTLGKTLQDSTMYLRRMGGDDVVRAGMRSAANIIGRGSYIGGSGSTVRNGLAEGGMSTAPVFAAGGDDMGGVTLTHCEYLTDIYGNDAVTSFDNTPFSINPGLERTFPWLAQTATNFDEYEFIQLMFEFRSTISDAPNTNGQVGTIIMATNYNVSDTPFTDKGTMMQYGAATSSKVISHVQHFVECNPEQLSGSAGKYVRNSPTLISQDPKTYDLGLFQIAVSGTPSTFADQPIGELWVHYKVKLRKPKLFTGQGKAISKDVFSSSSDRNTGGPTGSFYFPMFLDSLIIKGQQNSIGILVAQTTSGSSPATGLTFPAMTTGFYEIIIYANLNGIVAGNPVNSKFDIITSIPTGTNGSALTLVKDLPLEPTTSPSASVSKTGAQYNNAGTYQDATTIFVVHVQAQPQYGNQLKQLNIVLAALQPNGTPLASVGIQNIYITVTEYNPMSAPSVAPVFVNSAGAVTLPA